MGTLFPVQDLPPAIQLRLSLLLNRELVKNIPLLKQLELNTIVSLMQVNMEPESVDWDCGSSITSKTETCSLDETWSLMIGVHTLCATHS